MLQQKKKKESYKNWIKFVQRKFKYKKDIYNK